MAACPRCGSFLVAGTACEFCARYGGPAPAAGPQPWQPPAWTPPYQPPQYSATPARSFVDTGINLLELSWARTRVTWAWVLVGAIGGLTVGSYWVITRHPDFVAQLLLGFLINPDKVGSDSRTALDVLQIIAYFILSWIPLAGWALHGFLNPATSTLDALARATDISPLLYEGVVYLVLAVLIWRRSMVALGLASFLFLADSGVYGYGVFKLFQQLSDLNQKYLDLVQNKPGLAGANPYDMGHWPWGLVVPIVVRVAILWFFLTTFGGMGTVRLHHRRLKLARSEQQSQAA